MKHLKEFILFLLLYICSGVSAQNSFIPLHKGDSFLYKSGRSVPGGISYTYVTKRITKDSIFANGNKYFFHQIFNNWVRYDSLNRNFLIIEPSYSCLNYVNERIIDSLAARQFDSVKSCRFYAQYCTFRGNDTVMGQIMEQIRFESYAYMNGDRGAIEYGWNVGIIGYGGYSNQGGGYSYVLKGAIVNGVLYGDTSTTSVTIISSLIPEKFSLHQNYPNPFNPSTRINYELRNSNYVSLKVFDLLGKEVATLVNEKQNAGSYAVDFNSTEFNLPSGIYFYTLNAGEFKETRKMVLVK